MGYRPGRGPMDAVYVLKTGIKNEIRKPKGKAYVMFADVKGAFDEVKREELWKKIEEMGISKQLRVRIEELYEETRSKIVVNKKVIGRLRMRNGVRQGCPLSEVLFNILKADLENTMKKTQDGGIVIGMKKIWTVGYADDVALIANDEEGIRSMMKTYK